MSDVFGITPPPPPPPSQKSCPHEAALRSALEIFYIGLLSLCLRRFLSLLFRLGYVSVQLGGSGEEDGMITGISRSGSQLDSGDMSTEPSEGYTAYQPESMRVLHAANNTMALKSL